MNNDTDVANFMLLFTAVIWQTEGWVMKLNNSVLSETVAVWIDVGKMRMWVLYEDLRNLNYFGWEIEKMML